MNVKTFIYDWVLKEWNSKGRPQVFMGWNKDQTAKMSMRLWRTKDESTVL
jgi:hypothetical protein